MISQLIKNNDREQLARDVQEWTNEEERLVIAQYTFYDWTDEKHKTVIHFYN